MIVECALTNVANWQQEASQYLLKGDYSQAANLYEQLIAAQPDVKSSLLALRLDAAATRARS